MSEPATDPGLDSCEWNEVLAALTHHWRRFLLQSLLTEGEPQSCEELSAALADGPAPQPDNDDAIETVRSQLYHVHLPKLESADLVTYDRASEVVTLGRNATFAAPILTRLKGDDAVPPA